MDCDLSEVTVYNFLNNTRCVFNDESKTKILAHIDKQLIENKHICDQTNHDQVSYGNDGPFFSFYSLIEPGSKKNIQLLMPFY